MATITRYYVDASGNYLGGFSEGNPAIPGGAIEVPNAPDNVTDKFIAGVFVPQPLTFGEKFTIATQTFSTDETTALITAVLNAIQSPVGVTVEDIRTDAIENLTNLL